MDEFNQAVDIFDAAYYTLIQKGYAEHAAANGAGAVAITAAILKGANKWKNQHRKKD